jgi:predicted RNA-binding Zn ribbon-like protein
MQALCLDILNSGRPAKHVDRLLQSGWLEHLLVKRGCSITGSPDTDTIAAFQALRSLMQQLVQTLLQEQPLSEEALAALNSYLDAAPFRAQVARNDGRYQVSQVPLTENWEWVLGQVALSFADLLGQDPRGIKQCSNPDCGWNFYDDSAHRNRRWCREACANRMRVRRFREKQRAQGRPEPEKSIQGNQEEG